MVIKYRFENLNLKLKSKEDEQMKLKFKNAETKSGWTVKSMGDLILALYEYAYFQTVPEEILEDAIIDSAKEGIEFENVHDLAKHIAAAYV